MLKSISRTRNTHKAAMDVPREMIPEKFNSRNAILGGDTLIRTDANLTNSVRVRIIYREP